MLTKVDRVTHIGRFQVLQHRAEGLRRLALIFARNGFGKSTICAVVRSASTQDPSLIVEREHLGSPGVPAVTLQFDPGGTTAYNNGTWNRTPPPILLFDQDYIRSNVHVAEEVTTDNKRSLLRVIIGAAGVTLTRQLAELDQEATRLNSEIRELESSIRKIAPVVRDIAAFVAAAIPSDLVEKIAAARRVLAQAHRTSEIRRRPDFITLSIGAEPQSYIGLLREGLDGHLEDASGTVTRHLSKHGLGENGRRWLNFGLDHSNGNDCPFCDQDLRESQTIDAFKVLFGPDYKNLSSRLDNAEITTRLALNGQTSLEYFREQNEIGFTFWSSVAEIPPLGFGEGVDWSRNLDALRWMAAALKVKASNPSEPLDVPDDKAEAWCSFLENMNAYNATVEKANTVIWALKEEMSEAVAVDVIRCQETLEKWIALERRSQPELHELCNVWLDKQARRTALTEERSAKQAALRQHTADTASAYESGINDLLEDFGTNFRFCQAKANYVGGANVQYCIDVNGHALNVSDPGKGVRPSFRTVLSSGDKMSLALALFVTQVRSRSDISDLILIFDDPFSSQDAGRQFETSARIRELASSARQAVVLSHDARFLHLIKKDAGDIDCSEHQISLEPDWKGRICAWSSEEEVRSDYVRRAERIRGFAGNGQHLSGCSAPLLASDLRIFLEEYLDLRFPGRFAPRTLLGAMIDEIDASPDDPLYDKRLVLREINEYSRPDHHRGTVSPDPTQLRAQCKKIVKIIGAF